jgi:hypothetical protein
MALDELKGRLRELKAKELDPESGHVECDELLLRYIDDDETCRDQRTGVGVVFLA